MALPATCLLFKGRGIPSSPLFNDTSGKLFVLFTALFFDALRLQGRHRCRFLRGPTKHRKELQGTFKPSKCLKTLQGTTRYF